MNIRKVRVRVSERFVFVRMAMRLVAFPEKIMRVLVMLVVLMPMFVFERFMLVRMFMALAQM